MRKDAVIIDGNEAAAYIAHRTSEVIAIFPITPSSTMAELADAWSASGQRNVWGAVPTVVEMQSEGGVAGAVHGALTAGALTTTFTASQGLLLMIPDMYKIAGELTPAVFHVAARAVATHALSIFGDHSDVMAARSTGWAMLCASSVQEAHDFALIATAAALRSRIPFVHFFDGFRTSHELNRVSLVCDEQIRAMVPEELVEAHRERRLTPDHPSIRGTAQNPDVFFQSREAANRYYEAAPGITQGTMDQFAALTGRQYRLFEYVGAPDAARVMVLMGSACGAAEETVEALMARGEKVGLLKVRLYRPFSAEAFVEALPASTRAVAVLDRTKEPGATGEPLYQDVVTALSERVATGRAPFATMPRMAAGRYGLGSKEFTPAMVAAVFEELGHERPKTHFTVGIEDDVTGLSLDHDASFSTEPAETRRAVFFALGSDGTVGANKNTAKIVGDLTGRYAQGYFVYDSKKSGSMTVSHLRFSDQPIRSTYLIEEADFVACHQFQLLESADVCGVAAPGGTLLLNSPHGQETWGHLPLTARAAIREKGLRVYVVDASRVAAETELGGRVNTVLQTCFFALTDLVPLDDAVAAMKAAIKKSYGGRGAQVLARNYAAVDAALSGLEELRVPGAADSRDGAQAAAASEGAEPAFVRDVTRRLLAGEGDRLPVSALPADGRFPSGTARYEKRGIAAEIPAWDPGLCIECAKCALVCPHAAIRINVFGPERLAAAPEGFQSRPWSGRELAGQTMTVQVAPDDCTGCGVCVDICPAVSKAGPQRRSLEMAPREERLAQERANWQFFSSLPEPDRLATKAASIKGSQLRQPLFEFSGACAGCGETPYLKLLSQLFGDRLLIANATGCSSIYGGNLPTTPWTVNGDGRGPAWANSLFEDNAEFGLGMRLAVDQQQQQALVLLRELEEVAGHSLAKAIREADQSTDAGIEAQRARVAELKARLGDAGDDARVRRLLALADALTRKSVWIVGGDGWAYDIGFGGLDHVLASGQDVNVLVLDTEVYSNTGGQASKSTPRGAVAKFAASGKRGPKKDLGFIATSYGDVYVAKVALGADNMQTIRALTEAEAFPGPSLVIAYSHCIAHGAEMGTAMRHQRAAVESGYWPLFRYDPRADAGSEHAFHLDSKAPSIPFSEFARGETRFRGLADADTEDARALREQAQADIDERWQRYERLAEGEHGGGEASP